MNRDSEEEALSALLDGELSAEREEEIRLRMANDPALAARCAEMAEVNGLLQTLAEPQPEPERLQRMHEELRARIQNESADSTERMGESRPAKVIPLVPRRARNLVMATAAMAAALALYLVMGQRGEGPIPVSPSEPVSVAKSPTPEAVAPVAPETIVDSSVLEEVEADSQWAQVPVVEEATSLPSAYPEEVAPVLPQAEAAEVVVAAAEASEPMTLPDSDERLAIALDYDMLADFDVISNLELLEFLGELEDVESM